MLQQICCRYGCQTEMRSRAKVEECLKQASRSYKSDLMLIY